MAARTGTSKGGKAKKPAQKKASSQLRAGAHAAPAPEPEEDKPAAAVDYDANAAQLRLQLERIPGLTRENRAALVRDYYANGKIKYEDMQSLLAGI